VSVALVIQHVRRMRRIILLSVSCLALPVFPHYFTNGTIFGGGGAGGVLNIKRVFLFYLQLLSETLLVLGRINLLKPSGNFTYHQA
jgi:hypothetical protein